MDKEIKALINQTAHTLSQRQYAIYRQSLAEAVKRLKLAGMQRIDIVDYLNQAAGSGEPPQTEVKNC